MHAHKKGFSLITYNSYANGSLISNPGCEEHTEKLIFEEIHYFLKSLLCILHVFL